MARLAQLSVFLLFASLSCAWKPASVAAKADPGPDEPCVKDAYPPDPSTKVSTYTLSLDDPPEKRWQQITSDHKKQILVMIDFVLNFIEDFANGTFIPLIEKDLGYLADTFPYPYGDELKGIASVLGCPLGDVVVYNIFYEIFSVCTSIVGQDKSGTLYHARNLDFGLFMGWDVRNDTWEISELLRPMVVNVEYMQGGKLLFKAVHFAGYIGVLSGLRPSTFTLTMNERFTVDGGYIGILEWIFGERNDAWMGFLTRDTLANATSFTEAMDKLSNTPMLAPAYFILGGAKSGEGVVITRSRDQSLSPLQLNLSNGTWYVLETNYDHWKSPLFIDDRRTPAHKCMDELGQAEMGLPGLFNVLSTKPVLNKLTTYTALLQVEGEMETYRRQCPDPCWPW